MSFTINTNLDDATMASFRERLSSVMISVLKDVKPEDEDAVASILNVKVADVITPPPSDIVIGVLPSLTESTEEEEEDVDEDWEDFQRSARALDEIDDMKRSGGFWSDFDYNNYDYDRLDDRYNGNNQTETGLDWNESGYFD